MAFHKADLTILRSLVTEEQGRAIKKMAAAGSDDERGFYRRVMSDLSALATRLAERGAADRLEKAVIAEQAELDQQADDESEE